MDQIKVGEFIRSLRKAKGLSQQEVADSLLVTQKTVSRWENGEGVPDISIISDVAKFFDVSVDELLNGEKINKEQSESTSKRKEIDRTKLVKRQLLSKLDLFIMIPLLSCLGMILVTLIILFTTGNEVVTLVLLLFSLLASLMVFIFGYVYNYNKLKDDDIEGVNIDSIKEDFHKKLVMFADYFAILFFVSMLIIWFVGYIYNNYRINWVGTLNGFIFIVVLSLTYLIIRPMIKNCKFDLAYIESKSCLLFALFMITPIFDFSTSALYRGFNNITFIPQLFLRFYLNKVTMPIFIIIGSITLLSGIGLTIYSFLKNKKFVYLSLIITFIGSILPLFDFSFFAKSNVTMETNFIILNIFSLLIAIAIYVYHIYYIKKISS